MILFLWLHAAVEAKTSCANLNWKSTEPGISGNMIRSFVLGPVYEQDNSMRVAKSDPKTM